MSTRKSTISLLAGTLLASTSFAALLGEPETPGSEAPKIVAEAIHNARVHGIDARAQQLVAQMPGSEQAQAVSESVHLKKEHGNVNDSADQRMLREASRL